MRERGPRTDRQLAISEIFCGGSRYRIRPKPWYWRVWRFLTRQR